MSKEPFRESSFRFSPRRRLVQFSRFLDVGTLSSNCWGGQVIAPFLTTLRVANRTALTANNVPTRNTDVGSFRFRSEGKSTGHETLPDGNPVTASGEASGERGVRVETTVDQTQL